ncbi:MAG: histidine triad nucleotide-binding protein [Halanaerobium sp.]|nr:histidine triad nucleotide-binding protein [Halanaerobium sp.]
MSDCIFCQIVEGKVADILYEDDRIIVIEDINPQAPIHYLLIPKEHIPTLWDLGEGQAGLVDHIYQVAARLAKEEGLDEGFRLVSNCGSAGGQTVYHIPFHLLGGRKMQWPPG